MRSQGNWSAIKAMGRLGMREKSDERILGSGEFVEHLLKQADEVRKQQFSANDRIKTAQQLVEKICQKEKISVEALRSGSRRQLVSKARTQIAVKLVEENGLSLAQTARHLGVSTSAIAKLLDRRKSKSN